VEAYDERMSRRNKRDAWQVELIKFSGRVLPIESLAKEFDSIMQAGRQCHFMDMDGTEEVGCEVGGRQGSQVNPPNPTERGLSSHYYDTETQFHPEITSCSLRVFLSCII
jgi:hypothetical protein